MIGRYKNFPENVHIIAVFQHQNTIKSLQQTVFQTFHRLNTETFDLGDVTPYLKQNCEVGFEFGVAEDVVFNFLDQEELDQCQKNVEEKRLTMLDFFFVVRYHIIRKGGKRVALRFDYHLLRLTFSENSLEMRIRHEKGTQHIALDDLTKFMVKQMNVELSRMQLAPLVFGDFAKVRVK